MKGDSFKDLDSFYSECSGGPASVDVGCILAKSYLADDLRRIAEHLKIGPFPTVDVPNARTSYHLASKINSAAKDPKSIGEALAYCDHNAVFPYLSYFKLPDDWGSDLPGGPDQVTSAAEFRDWWNHWRKGYDVRGEYRQFRNFIANPVGQTPEIESLRIDEEQNTASFVLSAGRICKQPDFDSSASLAKQLFYNRIPILARLLFDKNVLELSLDSFSTPYFAADAPFQFHHMPERLMQPVLATVAQLQGVLPQPPAQRIDGNRVILYLEENREAQDLGWDIERKQSRGQFDLKQHRVQLKTILKDFTDEFQRKCNQLNEKNPLAHIDLYRLFRAIKDADDSYTYSMKLEAKLGAHKGIVYIDTFFGGADRGYHPLYYVKRKRTRLDAYIRTRMAEAVSEAINAPPVEPYSVSGILADIEQRKKNG